MIVPHWKKKWKQKCASSAFKVESTPISPTDSFFPMDSPTPTPLSPSAPLPSFRSVCVCARVCLSMELCVMEFGGVVVQMSNPGVEGSASQFILVYTPSHHQNCLTKYVYDYLILYSIQVYNSFTFSFT
jgi:hypothetical protein